MWVDEKKNEENRMPMHTAMFVYSNMHEAAQNEWEKSVNYLSLNGNWKFNFGESPDRLPTGYESVNFNDKSWDTFKVPATWEVNG